MGERESFVSLYGRERWGLGGEIRGGVVRLVLISFFLFVWIKLLETKFHLKPQEFFITFMNIHPNILGFLGNF